MDDLAGLDWNAANQQPTTKPTPLSSTTNYYPSLKPTPPLSGRTTPLSSSIPKALPTQANNPKPNTDSFASLLPSFSSGQPSKSLSLKEQQAQQEEQKRQRLVSQSRQWDSLAPTSTSTSANVSRNASPAPFFVQAPNGQSNGNGELSRTATPLDKSQTQQQSGRKRSEDISDILAAFDADTPVDSSSHFPVPSRPDSRNIALPPARALQNVPFELAVDDDDDPFGLGTAQVTTKVQAMPATSATNNDDDVLGLLGKPMSELPSIKANSSTAKVEAHPVDGAIAELVDMGFSAEKARAALASTKSGLDVQEAVGHLLNEAHSQSRNQNRERSRDIDSKRNRYDERDSEGTASSRKPTPSSQRGDGGNGPSKDSTKLASEIGNNFFKTANSLWKAGQKKVNKAMAEFNTEADSSQPKWMRDASQSVSTSTSVQSQSGTRRMQMNGENSGETDIGLTNEAALLEMGERPQSTRSKKAQSTTDRAAERPAEKPRWQHDRNEMPALAQSRASNQGQPNPVPARVKLTREMNEEASSYISPARRKKAVPKAAGPESSLLVDAVEMNGITKARQTSVQPSTQSVQQSRLGSSQTSTTKILPSGSKPESRVIAHLSTITLESSTSNRLAGTTAFKLGNYAEAHEAYSKAMHGVPKQHPLIIVLLTNRALTSLKTGDPKQCIIDADQAIEIIGPARGANETIMISDDEGTKDMAPYWGKAMMRRAEAMEQLERWADAAKVWKECVEAGVGGAQSVQGRARCEKASGVGPASQPMSRRPTPVAKISTSKPIKRSAVDDLVGNVVDVEPSGAVSRLRAANDAAAKLDDERFALTDAVAAKIETWRKGKEQNLRALLGSLDTVLWPDSGWKKIGMSELLNPSKVKINYMKGIAKVHPDKLPTTATTEQIMISGAVFSTLNEAWDGFKKENGL